LTLIDYHQRQNINRDTLLSVPGLFASAGRKAPGQSKTVEHHAYLDSGTTSKHFLNRKKRKKISETLAIKRKSRLELVKYLYQLGETNYADSMSKCGSKWSVMSCGEHIASKIPFHRCNIRFCPSCSNRRPAKFVKKYVPYVSAFLKQNPTYAPCLLTLTQKKIKGESKRKARKRILESFKKIIRRKHFLESFAGGIWACEVTESDSGNHCHLHIFIFRKAAWGGNMAQREASLKMLKSEWAKVSPGAKNLNLKLIDGKDGIESGLREVIKYISKPIPADNLTLDSVKQVLELKGLRMLDTFGEFRAFCRDYEIPEDENADIEAGRQEFVAGECCPCDGCDKPLFERILTENEMIAHHRRRELVLPVPNKFRVRGSPG
jgi:plasmid rolling circle replication initiator protein Rep